MMLVVDVCMPKVEVDLWLGECCCFGPYNTKWLTTHYMLHVTKAQFFFSELPSNIA